MLANLVESKWVSGSVKSVGQLCPDDLFTDPLTLLTN